VTICRARSSRQPAARPCPLYTPNDRSSARPPRRVRARQSPDGCQVVRSARSNVRRDRIPARLKKMTTGTRCAYEQFSTTCYGAKSSAKTWSVRSAVPSSSCPIRLINRTSSTTAHAGCDVSSSCA
jgi:hypothetical protein